MFRLENNQEALYQWDSNQRLIVTDATITDIHYCNRTSAEALVVEVYEEGGVRYANVPNVLLMDAWNICTYAYCNGCYTKQIKLIKVIARSKPADYVYTETEIKRWADLEAELKADMAALEAENKVTFANVLKGVVSGTEALVNDVSPMPHKMDITTVANGEVILWSGKNLFDVTPIKGKTVKQNGGTLTCSEDGYISGSGTPTGGCGWNYTLGKLPKVTMVLSAHGEFDNLAAVIYLRDKDGKSLGYAGVDNSRKQISVKPQNYSTFDYATVEIKRSGSNYEMKGGMYLQLEIGNKTDYEPATTPITYTANEEGVVEGVDSINPTFTFTADNETTIKYNRDTNAVIQQLTNAIISLGGNV